MCAEFLTGALTGGFHDPPPGKPWGEGALVVAFSETLFPQRDVASEARTYLERFDSYPGLHAQRSISEHAKDGIEYPFDVLKGLDGASQERGLTGSLAPD